MTADILRARLAARDRDLRSVRALATVRYSSARERAKLREVVVVEKPDRLRLEMLSPFGLALQIASDGTELRAWHSGEKTFYRGRVNAENLLRFTRFALDLKEIVDILRGIPPLPPTSLPADLVREEPTGLWRLSLRGSGANLANVWFDGSSLLPVRAEEIEPDGSRRFLVEFAHYRDLGATSLPFSIVVTLPLEGATIDLLYEDVAVNVPVPPELFSFERPPGSRIVELDSP